MDDSLTTKQHSLMYRCANTNLEGVNLYYAVLKTIDGANLKTGVFKPESAGEVLLWFTEVKTYGIRNDFVGIDFYKYKTAPESSIEIDSVRRLNNGEWLSTGLYKEMQELDEVICQKNI